MDCQVTVNRHEMYISLYISLVLGELTPSLVGIRVFVFQPVTDSEFPLFVEYPRDIEFYHAIGPQLVGKNFDVLFEEHKEGCHLVFVWKINQRKAGNNTCRHYKSSQALHNAYKSMCYT